MSFTPTIKRRIEKNSHFSCCICYTKGVQIHHIVSQADGGADTEENGAPLCPNCHDLFGANPTKKRFIRDCRDAWYEICSARFAKAIPSKQYSPKSPRKKSRKKFKALPINHLVSELFRDEFLSVGNDTDIMPTCYSLMRVIFDNKFWRDADERLIKRQFLKLYGELTSCRLILLIMKQSKLKLGRGLTAKQFGDLFGSFKAAVYLFLLVKTVGNDDHGVEIGFRDGQLAAGSSKIVHEY